MPRSKLTKYYVTVSRCVTQESKFWLDAEDEEDAADKAIDMAAEVATLVWDYTSDEPHTITVEDIIDGATVGKGENEALRREENPGT